MKSALCAAFFLLVFTAAQPALAQTQTLQQRVESRLAEAGPGTRFGLVVAAEDGRELIAIAPDSRFVPASNTKIVTSAAAFEFLPGLDLPDREAGAAVRLEEAGSGWPDVVLQGNGDGRLSSAADCVANCLAALADAVAARTRLVRNIIGDDSLFPDQRWSPGMSWNNIPTRSGTATSALSLDDNELKLRVLPAAAGRPPTLELLTYYGVENRALTVAAGGVTALGVDRIPGSMVLRLSGTIAADAAPQDYVLGMDDPAHYAAWRLKALLEARGVRVTGAVSARHRAPTPADDDPALRKGAPLPSRPGAETLAALVPPPLAEDLVHIGKESQNLHSELLLRRLGRLGGGAGSIADGLAVVREMLGRAGVPKHAYGLSDGSGISTYNRIAPRGMVALLRWIAARPWGAAWRSTLPVGGVDGTLDDRFKGTSLQGRIFAKTGTLHATNALSGYMIAKSGRTLTFSAFANDVPEGASATGAIDSVLELIAAEN